MLYYKLMSHHSIDILFYEHEIPVPKVCTPVLWIISEHCKEWLIPFVQVKRLVIYFKFWKLEEQPVEPSSYDSSEIIAYTSINETDDTSSQRIGPGFWIICKWMMIKENH